MAGSAPIRKRLGRFLALSSALHVVLAVFLLIVWTHTRPRVVEQPTKFYATTLHVMGGIRAPWTPAQPGRKRHATVPAPKPHTDLARTTRPAPPKGEPLASLASAGAGAGTDADNANPAFPVFSPRPAVADRSLLPSANREVVVDVKVSAQGDVLEATLVKGIGNALDGIVLQTVKTWRFHPASIAGNPVASEAELIFPFNMNYPTTRS
ncbi:MAG: TonB family protein [Terracidiphilus sp.]